MIWQSKQLLRLSFELKTKNFLNWTLEISDLLSFLKQKFQFLPRSRFCKIFCCRVDQVQNVNENQFLPDRISTKGVQSG
jgi:hypothetical protein